MAEKKVVTFSHPKLNIVNHIGAKKSALANMVGLLERGLDQSVAGS